jgi:hypothetical protein
MKKIKDIYFDNFIICYDLTHGETMFISGDAHAPPHIYNFAPTMLLHFYVESPQFSVLHQKICVLISKIIFCFYIKH